VYRVNSARKNKVLAWGGVAGAAMLAAVAWMAPLSSFQPPPMPPAETQIPAAAAPPPIPKPEDLPKPDWNVLLAKLVKLRDPAPAATESPVEVATPQPGAPPAFSVSWVYLAMIEQPGHRAALVDVGGRQKFIFEGESYRDPNDPERPPIRLARVERDKIIVDVNGSQQEIARRKSGGSSMIGAGAAIANPPQQPGRADQAGRSLQ